MQTGTSSVSVGGEGPPPSRPEAENTAQRDRLCMELTRLLLLLALLQSLSRLASPTDSLPAPTLSLGSSYRVYLPGERVILTCAAPRGESVSGYRFYFQNEEQGPSTVLSTNAGARLEVTAEKGRAGPYTCAYWRRESSRDLPSRNSSSVSIAVADRAPPASLTVEPPCPKYLVGEQLMLTCVAPQTDNVTGYRFYIERNGEIVSRDPDANREAQLFFPSLRMVDAGSYTCKYWRDQSGQEILSVGSQPVSVSVLDFLSPPALSVDPPSGVIKKWLPLLLTCTAPQRTGEQRFHFYKDGITFLPQNVRSQIHPPGSRNVSVLGIPRARLSSAGKFTCGYEEKVCRKWGLSPRSQAVHVTVTENNAFLVRFLAVGGSFFLINGLIFLVSHRCL